MLVRKTIPIDEEFADDGYTMAHDLIGKPAHNIEGEVVGFIRAAWYDPIKMSITYDAEVLELEEPRKRRMKRFDKHQGEEF